MSSMRTFGILSLASIFAAPTAFAAGTVTQITDFGDNPTGIGMYLYTPANVAAKPAVVVGVHACHGKGTDVCSSNNAFAQQADKWGFLLVCPSAVSSDGCWDVQSTKVMTHDGGGDAKGIISMVKYVLANKNGDASRVYVMGHSSGGMTTNILLGSYPEVFQAGAAYAGVPFGCFGTGTVDSLGWNTECAQGKISKTGPEWGNMVRAAYPGYTGPRPRLQIWHGTKDDVLYFQNFKEAIKQWTNVFGLSETPTTTEKDVPQSTWIRTRYKDAAGVVRLEAIEETGQPHNLIVDAAEAMRFFGLDGSNPIPDAGVVDAGKDAGAVDAKVSPDVALSTGGVPATGGITATGGIPGTGGGGGTTGTIPTGGVLGMGGRPVTGGTAMTGGFPSTGGILRTGGIASTGGLRSTIGTGGVITGGTVATGAIAATGGIGATGGKTPENKGGSSGCHLSHRRSPIAFLSVLLFGVCWVRRRRDGKV